MHGNRPYGFGFCSIFGSIFGSISDNSIIISVGLFFITLSFTLSLNFKTFCIIPFLVKRVSICLIVSLKSNCFLDTLNFEIFQIQMIY